VSTNSREAQIPAGAAPMRHEAAPHAAVAEHQREEPDDPLGVGLIGEDGAEIGEIDLLAGSHNDARTPAAPSGG